jgi:AbrB family looped-hinge helix DNA binding protein
MSEYVARVTSKGQLTLPAALRKRLGIREGDSVTLTVTDDSAVLEKSKHTVESVHGSIPTPPHLVGRDLDEMIEEATAAHADEVIERMRQGLE